MTGSVEYTDCRGARSFLMRIYLRRGWELVILENGILVVERSMTRQLNYLLELQHHFDLC